MPWSSFLTAAVATVCFTLAAIHLVIWWKSRAELANLAFSILAAGAGLFAWSNDAMMRAETPDRFLAALRWANVPIFLMVVGVIAFVRLRFGTGRVWLAHATWVVRLITLVVNFARSTGMDYDAVTSMRRVWFLGDAVFVPEGVTSIWHWVGQVSIVLLGVFVIDASYSLFRSGNPAEKRRALMIGIPTSMFVLGGSGYAALIFSGVVQWPHLESVGFLGVLLVISYELSADVLRAARLARELQVSEAALRDSEQRMRMAADAARLGLWMWDMRTGQVWLTEKCRELFGFAPDVMVDYETFAGRLRPEDRATREAAIRRAIATESPYQSEYQVLLPGGRQRWISSQGRVDLDDAGRPVRMLGVCIDITEQRNAELAARELGGRLINAQEDERRRIARDLHDDLNQRLALLSVELELLGHARPETNPGAHAEELASRVRELSSDVHKLSYRLHPAKLDQLGIVTAARSWCRDVTQQSGVRVEFVSEGVPDDLSADVALCLFRIVQEALRNVVRHSGAAAARVELITNANGICLTITDGGRGFDPGQTANGSGLGLLSMQERVRLVNGTIEVKSSPGAGTSVIAAVPLVTSNNGMSHDNNAPAATC